MKIYFLKLEKIMKYFDQNHVLRKDKKEVDISNKRKGRDEKVSKNGRRQKDQRSTSTSR